MCQSELTELDAELAEFAAELSEFSLPKQHSRNSTPLVSQDRRCIAVGPLGIRFALGGIWADPKIIMAAIEQTSWGSSPSFPEHLTIEPKISGLKEDQPFQIPTSEKCSFALVHGQFLLVLMVVHLPELSSQCEEPCENYRNQK